ncbi:hypothetical protein HYW72_02165 [Candidatus Nomurabacteria bacterium]|nr:hypothetical protein [Candidatus Nomurabacteria bacterium]
MAPMKTLAPATAVTTRDPQGLKFVSIVEAAYNKARLSEGEEAQRVNDTPGLSELIANFIANARLANKYANEEVPSRYGYFSGYKPGVQDLDRQIARLQELFPGLGSANPEYLEQVKSGKVALPKCCEKFGTVPNWKKRLDLFGAIYNDVLATVLGLIKETRNGKFNNYREGQLGQERLRQSARSIAFWNQLIEEQGNPDILIVPFQFGFRHRGRSTRRATEVMIGTLGEFGLGAFAISCLLLTHEERLQNYDDLWIDAPGDEFDDPDSGVRFGHAPYFRFRGGRVGFGTDTVGPAGGDCGSASGVVPQK